MKKHFQISLIFLIAIGYLPFGVFTISANIAETDKSLHVIIQKKNESYEVTKLDIALEQGVYQGNYESFVGKMSNGVIISSKGEKLGYFSVSNNLEISICKDSVDIATGKMSGGCSELPEGELTIDMPYFPNGKYADIYDLYGKKVLTIDLSSKATCNENDQCDQPIEDSENCPQDCQNNEPKIDPAVVQLAVSNQSMIQENFPKLSDKSANWIIIIVFGIIVIIAGLGFWLWRRYREYKSKI